MEENTDLRQVLTDGAKEFSVFLDELQVDCFMKYKALLMEWNEKFNLTAVTDEMGIIVKHFLDSLSISPFINPGKTSLIDVGTGAGFPGIPLKIAFGNTDAVLLDSLQKRVKFLNAVIEALDLRKTKAVHARAEDAASSAEYRERFDVSVARAVADMPILLEYCLPFVKAGGIFIAMKGSSTEELASSKKALEVLGGEIEEIKPLLLPFSDIKRNIIIVRKLRHTPTKYPRKAGKPSKDPLV